MKLTAFPAGTIVAAAVLASSAALATTSNRPMPVSYATQERYVDTGEVLLYTLSMGRGAPLVILHGGPGASHDYMIAAWGEGYFPYLYQKRPDPGYDPVSISGMSWDLYREMWGSHGEFVIDGNLASVEYADRLGTIKVPTLITVGDRDESDPSLARDMNARIPGSKLVVLPDSGHMTFVDQPAMFLRAVDEFLNPPRPPSARREGHSSSR